MIDRPGGDLSLAVIPARGGSKRIPRKNVRNFAGRPLLAWAIDLALSSGLFARVVVSTDDDEIAQVALDAGAEVPFLRPASLSGDMTPTVEVMSHAVGTMVDLGFPGATACCIYPAAVLVEEGDLRQALNELRTGDSDYVAAILRYQHPIQRALSLGDGARIQPVDAQASHMRTQDLPPRWHDAGQFYWGRVTSWINRISILDHSAGYEIHPLHAVDIDQEPDWAVAEALHRALRGQGS